MILQPHTAINCIARSYLVVVKLHEDKQIAIKILICELIVQKCKFYGLRWFIFGTNQVQVLFKTDKSAELSNNCESRGVLYILGKIFLDLEAILTL